MTTITISRQWGSLGTQIAQEVADRLSYRMVWRDLINQAAQRAGAPEVALATIDELGLLGLHPSRKAHQAYLKAAHQVIEELAAEGQVVIVGRAGQVILRDRPDVFHVRVMAPSCVRVERTAHTQSIPLGVARAQVETSDRARKDYLHRYYHVWWDDTDLYDLVINTARLTHESAANLICGALEQATQTAETDSAPWDAANGA